MFAWTIWSSCVIICVSLQSGQAERIRGNDLNDDYDVDLDGLGTDVWTERDSIRLETEVSIDNRTLPDVYIAKNSTPSGTGAENNSTRSRTDIWTDGNSNGSGTDVPPSRPETDISTDNDVTRQETDIPTDNNKTQPKTDVTTVLRTKSSKTTVSIDERLIGINTTRIPEIVPPDVCQNSSCPEMISLTTTVPEGGNVTLSCGSVLDTAKLWWYRDATFLQFDVGNVVLHITDVDISYSGPYLCVDERGCCILEHHVSVYHVPLYAYHLAVMGVILAVGMPLCVFLSVRQSSRLGRNARMLKEKHGEAEHLIW